MDSKRQALERAIDQINSGEVSCVAILDGQIYFGDKGRGVSSLLKLHSLLKAQFAQFFEGEQIVSGLGNAQPPSLIIADKIIGRAAAMLSKLMNASLVFGTVMSQSAHAYLVEQGIEAQYGTLVARINNRTATDICPIEKAVVDIDDPTQALSQIKATLMALTQPKTLEETATKIKNL